MRQWINLVENVTNPNLVTVYHGDTKPGFEPYRKSFFSTCRREALSYGPHITEHVLDTSRFIDTLDPNFVEEFLPFYDHYDDREITTVQDYMERSSDTWEMVEDKADEIMHVVGGAAGLIVYEGGCRNFMVYDVSAIKSSAREVPQADGLLETYHSTQRVSNEYFEGDVEVLRNPSRAEFMKGMREHGAARGFLDIDSRSVYVWFAAALHGDIEAPGEVWITWHEPQAEHVLLAYDVEALAERIPEGANFIAEVKRIIMSVPAIRVLTEGFEPVLGGR